MLKKILISKTFLEIECECYREQCEGFYSNEKAGYFGCHILAKPADTNEYISKKIYWAHV